MSIGLQKLMATLVEQAIDIACACKCLIIAIGIQLCQFSTVVLKLNVWRIADHDVKAIVNPEHPFRIEEIGNGILIVWIPFCKLLSISRSKVIVFSQQTGQFLAKLFVLLA